MPEEGVYDVAAVELPDGKEIECGDKKTDPAGKSHGAEKHHLVGVNPRQKEVGQTRKDERSSQVDRIPVEESVLDDGGLRQTDDAGSQGYDEAGQRAGCPDVEQSSVVRNRGADFYDRSQGAQKRNVGQRNEIGQGSLDPPFSGGEIVTEFVRRENSQQSRRKRNPLYQVGQRGGAGENVGAPLHGSGGNHGE